MFGLVIHQTLQSVALAKRGEEFLGKLEIITSIGLALRALETHGGTVVNADSRQLINALPILTAAPEPRPDHVLYGVCGPEETVSAGRFFRMVAALEAPKPWWIVGGTGFYLHALAQGLSPIPEVAIPVSDAPTDTLFAQLAALDSAWAQKIGPTDRQRILRGISVFEQTGRRLSDWHNEPRVPLFPHAQTLWVNPPRAQLLQNIDRRLDAMLDQGVLEEVRAFDRQHPNSIFSPIGLGPMRAFLAGTLSKNAMCAAVSIETRQYAKRQTTWFRHQTRAHWVLSEAEHVNEFLKTVTHCC